MKKILAALGAVAMLLVAAPAWGHGELESEIPEANSKLGKAPNHLILNFTEPPTKDAVFKVVDGCGDNVVDQTGVEERTGHIFLVPHGQPGKWKVSYDVVSAEDGHETSGTYALTVAGTADCSKAATGKVKQGGNGGGSAPTGAQEGDGGSFPIVPVVLGGVAVIALAVIARRAAG